MITINFAQQVLKNPVVKNSKTPEKKGQTVSWLMGYEGRKGRNYVNVLLRRTFALPVHTCSRLRRVVIRLSARARALTEQNGLLGLVLGASEKVETGSLSQHRTPAHSCFTNYSFFVSN